ncbi:conserved membrane protein of unknown function [uncultured Woeseiaceae bacterium]|uniref:DUF4956 domain-containing protein n=1 Tax=uncultured Woeseiaceae bacterium TaxID=1983305 RepID=A0A7D9D4L2_9GAMM|nr:conserved membrane protein of unknown function [uncultured Woeseiaceae bacterium]
MTSFEPTPAQLAIRLTLYFAVFFGALITMVSVWPDAVDNLPIGGHHALDFSEVKDEILTISKPESGDEDGGGFTATFRPTSSSITKGILFLSLHLSGTILLMIPITWTYMATRHDIGYQKNFARALIVLPICATTTILLIQDSLALAFGLAALVAAVRFRVVLEETVDGVFIFAAICVGLSAGIGYLGIASVFAVFFCFTILILWQMEFGENPLDEARQEKKRAKFAQPDKRPPA